MSARTLPIAVSAALSVLAGLAAGCPPGVPRLSQPVPDAGAPPAADGRVTDLTPPPRDLSPARDTGLDAGPGTATDRTPARADAGPEAGPGAAPDTSLEARPADTQPADTPAADPDAGGDAGDGGEAAVPARLPRPGDLAIVEVLIDPAGNDLGREWVEVVSLTDDAVDLGGLHVADSATDVAVDAGVLAARGILVIGQSADPANNGGAPVDRSYGTRLQLNNNGDRVALCTGPCADGLVLDVFAWSGALGAGYQGRAVAVDPISKAMCPATQTFGDGSSFGSPGAPNPACGELDAGADGFAP